MKNHGLVSVIIPTYKRANYLDRAIESVLNQSYEDFELIIVDDNDNNSIYRKKTEQIMEKYKGNPKITYVKHEKNLNGSAARNTGIKISKGTYIGFLDDDDEFSKYKLETQVSVLRDLSVEYGAVYCGYNVIRGGKLISQYVPTKEGKLTSELLQMIWGTGSGSNVLFRRSVFKRIGLFDETLKRHQDWDVLLRMFRYYRISPIKKTLLNIYKDSRVNIPNPYEFVEIKRQFFKKFEQDIEKLTVDEKNKIYKAHCLEISMSFLKTRNNCYAKKYYRLANSYSKVNLKERLTLFLTSIFFYLPFREKLLVYSGPIIEKIRIIKS